MYDFIRVVLRGKVKMIETDKVQVKRALTVLDKIMLSVSQPDVFSRTRPVQTSRYKIATKSNSRTQQFVV